MNDKVDELVSKHDLGVEVGDQEADVIALEGSHLIKISICVELLSIFY